MLDHAMVYKKHQIKTVLITIFWLLPTLLLAQQVSVEDYQRANNLQERFQGKALNVIKNLGWIEDTHHLWYRKTVRGGHKFIWLNAEKQQKRAAFDHKRLAETLSTLRDSDYSGLELPFETIKFKNKEQVIEFEVGDSLYTCSLNDYTCESEKRKKNRWENYDPFRDYDEGQEQQRKSITSPNSKWEAFVRNYNVAIRKKSSDEIIMLSTDGSEDNYYDIDTFEWSPDSKKLVAYRVIPGMHRQVHYLEVVPEDQLQPKHHQITYPKPGDVLDQEQPVLFNIETRKQFTIDDSLFPNAYYITNATWWDNSQAFYFEYNQRGHQVYRIIEVDAETGEARTLVNEEPEKFFSYYTTLYSFYSDTDHGHEIIWASTRDGYRHLYLYSGETGEVKNQITSRDWVVRKIDSVDTKKRQIWFQASGMDENRDPYFIHYFRVNFDGSGLTRMTKANGNHKVAYSDDMKYYVDTWSRVNKAPISQLRRTKGQKVVMDLEQGDLTLLKKAGWQAPEPFVAKGRDGKTDIWGVIIRPTNFDPNKNYPVIEYIYAGPHGSFVPKSFSSYNHMMSLAELGFIVVQIDGMGTANRSKEFLSVAWKNIKDSGFPDRIRWHKAVAKKYDYYDISKVGIYGYSAGGQSSVSALLFHPDFYKVAVAASGCYDNRMDKISWNEQWMGWPVGPQYAESSSVVNAWRLRGDLLLMVGLLDTNVPPASTFQLVDALIRAGKDFDLIVLPRAGHTSGVDLARRMRWDFFVENIKGAEPPHWNSMSKTQIEKVTY